MSALPTKALSVQQPWSWLIVNGHKDIENRGWRTSYRGPVLIHAGKRTDMDARDDLLEGLHPCGGSLDHEAWLAYKADEAMGQMRHGGIVGVVDIIDCVKHHPSRWFVGDYGFVLANARPLPFMPVRGQLSFFDCVYREPG